MLPDHPRVTQQFHISQRNLHENNNLNIWLLILTKNFARLIQSRSRARTAKRRGEKTEKQANDRTQKRKKVSDQHQINTTTTLTSSNKKST
jgi:hypothetical protein